MSIKSFSDYKHLVQENYVEYKYNFFFSNCNSTQEVFFCNTLVHLDDWLTVHRSITLVNLQLDAQNSYLFTYNTFIKILIFCVILVGLWEWVVTLSFVSRILFVVCLWLNYNSTLQHVLLLLHGERLIDNQFFSTCSLTCLQLLLQKRLLFLPSNL